MLLNLSSTPSVPVEIQTLRSSVSLMISVRLAKISSRRSLDVLLCFVHGMVSHSGEASGVGFLAAKAENIFVA